MVSPVCAAKQRETALVQILLERLIQRLLLVLHLAQEVAPTLLVRLALERTRDLIAKLLEQILHLASELRRPTRGKAERTWAARVLKVVDVAPLQRGRTPFRARGQKAPQP